MRSRRRAADRAVAATNILAVLLCAGVALSPVARAQDARAEVDADVDAGAAGAASFRYELLRTVGGGAGAYAGYSDKLLSAGSYEVDLTAVPATAHGKYAWDFRSSEKRQSGSEDRQTTFDAETLRYLERTDLDEYDGHTPSELAVWFYVPPGLRVGQHVRLLEQTGVVESVDDLIVHGNLQVRTVRIRVNGTGHRDDDYGRFDTRFEETYWFHARTGFILRTKYREHDTGFYGAAHASFHVTEELQVTSATYLPADLEVTPMRLEPPARLVEHRVAQGAVSSAPILLICVFLAVAVAIGLVIHAARQKKTILTAYGTSVSVKRTREIADVTRSLHRSAESAFAPLYHAFARTALAADDALAVAYDSNTHVLMGMAVRHGDLGIGSVFAENSEICEALRRTIGVEEFFSEVRHAAFAKASGVKVRGAAPPSDYAYNLVDTFALLELRHVVAVPYDASVVRRMAAEDRTTVFALAKSVLGVTSEKAFFACVDYGGDFGFVAVEAGEVVGFAFASEAAGLGRLHSLTVRADCRGRGLGKELTRARIRALADLGAQRVITEIAISNVASLAVAESFGFARKGSVFVESARATAPAQRLWWR